MDGLCKYIIELRFKPYSPILDRLGETAFKLLDNDLLHWEINAQRSRLDMWNEDKTFNFFLTYFNFGATFEDLSYIDKFIKITKPLLELYTNIVFTRFGFRSSYLYKYDGSFIKLKKKFKSELIPSNMPSYLPKETKLTDYSLAVVLKHKNNLANLAAGPVEESQSKKLLSKDETFPVGLYISTDYYREEGLPLDKQLRNIKEFLKEGVGLSESVSSTFKNRFIQD